MGSASSVPASTSPSNKIVVQVNGNDTPLSNSTDAPDKTARRDSDSDEGEQISTARWTNYVFNESTKTFAVEVQGTPLWITAIRQHFPGALREETFVRETCASLAPFGFTRDNTLVCVSVCRDEMCSPLLELIDQVWAVPYMTTVDPNGEKKHIRRLSFIMSSLAGMILLGKTGLQAAVSHAPIDNNRQRYVFYAMPHIALSDHGKLGQVHRPGREHDSTACGALVKLRQELRTGFCQLGEDPGDVEFSLLKQKLMSKMHLFGAQSLPKLEELTDTAHTVIHEDLKRLIDATVDTTTCDYAVCTGIQIHVPGGITYIQPKKMYAVVNGEEHALSLHADNETSKRMLNQLSQLKPPVRLPES